MRVRVEELKVKLWLLALSVLRMQLRLAITNIFIDDIKFSLCSLSLLDCHPSSRPWRLSSSCLFHSLPRHSSARSLPPVSFLRPFTVYLEHLRPPCQPTLLCSLWASCVPVWTPDLSTTVSLTTSLLLFLSPLPLCSVSCWLVNIYLLLPSRSLRPLPMKPIRAIPFASTRTTPAFSACDTTTLAVPSVYANY